MAVNHCDGQRLGAPCRCLFAVGLTKCPHCKSPDFHEFGSQPGDEEHPMAKISALGGPSNASVPTDEEPDDGLTEAEGTGVEMEPIEVEPGEESELTGGGSGEALPPVDDPDDGAGEESDAEPVEDPELEDDGPAESADADLVAEEGDGGDAEADPPVADEPSNADVREWAQANGIEVNASGPIPKAVREAFDEAHG